MKEGESIVFESKLHYESDNIKKNLIRDLLEVKNVQETFLSFHPEEKQLFRTLFQTQ